MSAQAKILSALLLSACLVATPAIAGPFGFTMGEPISKYKVAEALELGRYKIQAVPVPRQDMDFVVVTATPAHGICKVTAISKDFPHDAYGTDILGEFDELKSALNQKYGPSKNFNFLKAGALWDEPREFAMALYKEERTLSSFWPLEVNSGPMADNIANISLTAKALNTDTTYWLLSYEFTNFEACTKALEAKENDAL